MIVVLSREELVTPADRTWKVGQSAQPCRAMTSLQPFRVPFGLGKEKSGIFKVRPFGGLA